MKYYYLEPEVSGDIGERTVMDPSVHPPIVTKLNYEFNMWPCDVLIESFPCWIVTAPTIKKIQLAQLTGVSFDDVETTMSEQLRDISLNRQLPAFVWMKVHGTQGRDDFGVGKNFVISTVTKPFDPRSFILVVSQRALDLLQQLGISHATCEEFSK
jgi:hypothetical protein